MSKTLFTIISVALILATNSFGTAFGQPQGKRKPSGLITEIQFPNMKAPGHSAQSNRKTGNAVKWELGELDASSSSMRRKQNRQVPFDKGYLSPNAKIRLRNR